MSYPESVAELVRRRWGALLDEVGAEAAARYQAGIPLPRHYLAAAGEQGIQGLHFAKELGGEEVGGEEVDATTWGTVLEEIAYQCADSAFPILLSMGTGVADILAASGRPDLLDQQYLNSRRLALTCLVTGMTRAVSERCLSRPAAAGPGARCCAARSSVSGSRGATCAWP